jgi:NitT/TauT family transport system ATP-binding protein
MADAAAKLAVDRISKTFRVRTADGGEQLVPALRGVSFDVRDHEFVSVIGQSGCGKTTLLRIVQGLTRPDSGAILVGGKPVRGPGPDRGIVFQQANLLPWRTALKNVEFGLEIQHQARGERRRRAEALLDLVGLRGFEQHYPHQLSGGMQQRVGLARALAIDPQILLLDEPFGALDAQTREILQGELLRIYHETRKTVLFVTHDLDEAVYLSDRVVVLEARPGRVREIVAVPFGRPRADLTTLRGDPEFLQLRNRIWASIRPEAA